MHSNRLTFQPLTGKRWLLRTRTDLREQSEITKPNSKFPNLREQSEITKPNSKFPNLREQSEITKPNGVRLPNLTESLQT